VPIIVEREQKLISPTSNVPTQHPPRFLILKSRFTTGKRSAHYNHRTYKLEAMPDQIRIRPGQTVLFKVVNYPQRDPPNFIMGSYERKLGTAVRSLLKFNKIGNYDFRVVIPSDNPDTLPTEYAKGSIRVY